MPVVLSSAHAVDETVIPVRSVRASRHDTPSEFPTALSLGGFLRDLHPFSTRQHYSCNEVIFHEGDPAEYVYRTFSGTARLCRHSPSGARSVVDFVMEGEMFATSGCKEHPFSAEAVTAVTLSAYPRQKFESFVESKSAVPVPLVSLLTSELLATRLQLFVAGCPSAKQRLAAFLLRFAERTYTDPGERLELPMGRLDIADHLGVTIEALCRAIAALRDERIIVVPNSNQLILSNIAALNSLAADA